MKKIFVPNSEQEKEKIMAFVFENLKFKVVETISDFQIESKKTGKVAGMGDMVGTYYTNEGKLVHVGTEEFYQMLQDDLTCNQDQYMEAFFPEELEPSTQPTEKKIYLITVINSSDEYDETRYGILEVTAKLVDRLRKYTKIVEEVPCASSVRFDECCFDFVDYALEEAFPEIKSDIEILNYGQFFRTTIDLSTDVLLDRNAITNTDCHCVNIYKSNPSSFTFLAYNKYDGTEYSFEVDLEELEAALKEFDLDYSVITQEEKEKYLKFPNVCPKCGSSNIETKGSCHINESGAWQDMECNKCGFSWQDIYSLTDIVATNI